MATGEDDDDIEVVESEGEAPKKVSVSRVCSILALAHGNDHI